MAISIAQTALAHAQAELPVVELPINAPVPIFKDNAQQQNMLKPSSSQNTINSNQDKRSEQPAALQMLPSKKSRADTPFVHLPSATPQIDQLIQKYADGYGVPVDLVRRIVKSESGGNPQAHNRTYYGLMQIAPATARIMGFRGKAEELFDAEVNLRYGVRYLRGAYITADGDIARAIVFYKRGYYYDAKAKGILEETGLRAGPKSPKIVN